MAAIVSAGSGNFNTGATWVGGVAPTEGDTCQIANTHTVTIDGNITVGADTTTPAIDILSGGTLNWDNLGNDTLTLKGDFYVRSGGTLTLDGTGDGTKTLTVKLNYSASLASNKYQLKIENGATTTISGFNKTRSYDTIASNANSGQANIVTTNDNSSIWNNTDIIILPPYSTIVATTSYNDYDEKTVSSISGTTITADSNLTFAHLTGGIVMNMTRNIVFQPYDTTFASDKYTYGSQITGVYIVGNYPQMTFSWIQFKGIGFLRPYQASSFSYCSFYSSNATTDRQLGSMGGTTSVTYCCFHRVPGPSVSQESGTGVVISSNVFSYVTSYTSVSLSGKSTIFSNNYILGGGVNTTAYYGGSLAVGYVSVSGATISNNIFRNIQGIAITLSASYGNTFSNNSITYCGYGVNHYGGAKNTFNGETYNNNTADIYFALYSDDLYKNCFLTSTTTITLATTIANSAKLKIYNNNGDGGHKTYRDYGAYTKQSSVKYSGSYALLMSPTDADNELIAESTVFAKNTETVTYSCYMRKSASFAVLPYVKLSGAGITTSTATMTNSTDTWELLTVSGVATEDGFCKIEFVCQNGSGSVYVDDDPDTFTYWFEGDIPVIVPKPSLTANDIWNTQTAGLTASGSVGKHVKGLRNTIEIGG